MAHPVLEGSLNQDLHMRVGCLVFTMIVIDLNSALELLTVQPSNLRELEIIALERSNPGLGSVD